MYHCLRITHVIPHDVSCAVYHRIHMFHVPAHHLLCINTYIHQYIHMCSMPEYNLLCIKTYVHMFYVPAHHSLCMTTYWSKEPPPPGGVSSDQYVYMYPVPAHRSLCAHIEYICAHIEYISAHDVLCACACYVSRDTHVSCALYHRIHMSIHIYTCIMCLRITCYVCESLGMYPYISTHVLCACASLAMYQYICAHVPCARASLAMYLFIRAHVPCVWVTLAIYQYMCIHVLCACASLAMYQHMCAHVPCAQVTLATGWRRLIGSPKLQIIFHKRATKYRALLRKMTHKDKGSYESSPPCMMNTREYMNHAPAHHSLCINTCVHMYHVPK